MSQLPQNGHQWQLWHRPKAANRSRARYLAFKLRRPSGMPHANPVLEQQFRAAMNFWSEILDMTGTSMIRPVVQSE